VAPALDRLQMPSGVTETVGWLLALGTAAVLQMLLGELVPKNVAIAEPERTLRRLAPLHNVVVAVLRPAIWVLDRLAGLAVRPFGYTPVDEIEHAIGAPELSTMINASRRAGFIEEFEHGLLAGALDLGCRTVASVMVPRRAVVTVGRRMTLAEIEEVIVASGRSRLPVAAAAGDDLLGMFHVKDLLRLPSEAQDDSVPLELIRRMLVVAPEELLDDVLLRMRGARSHLAVVRDAGGMTVGIVSMEDVVEELVGDIRDESDVPGA
jgi:CBS domain containing-hemolysin-like protein